MMINYNNNRTFNRGEDETEETFLARVEQYKREIGPHPSALCLFPSALSPEPYGSFGVSF
jgi:hypothetical protein